MIGTNNLGRVAVQWGKPIITRNRKVESQHQTNVRPFRWIKSKKSIDPAPTLLKYVGIATCCIVAIPVSVIMVLYGGCRVVQQLELCRVGKGYYSDHAATPFINSLLFSSSSSSLFVEAMSNILQKNFQVADDERCPARQSVYCCASTWR
jgi:hypothetical protein